MSCHFFHNAAETFIAHIDEDLLEINANGKIYTFPLDENTKIAGGVNRQSNVAEVLALASDATPDAVKAMLLLVDSVNQESWLRQYCFDYLKLNNLPQQLPEGGLKMIRAAAALNLNPRNLGAAMSALVRGGFTVTSSWNPEVAFLLGIGYSSTIEF